MAVIYSLMIWKGLSNYKAIIYFDICSNLEVKRWDIKDK